MITRKTCEFDQDGNPVLITTSGPGTGKVEPDSSRKALKAKTDDTGKDNPDDNLEPLQSGFKKEVADEKKQLEVPNAADLSKKLDEVPDAKQTEVDATIDLDTASAILTEMAQKTEEEVPDVKQEESVEEPDLKTAQEALQEAKDEGEKTEAHLDFNAGVPAERQGPGTDAKA